MPKASPRLPGDARSPRPGRAQQGRSKGAGASAHMEPGQSGAGAGAAPAAPSPRALHVGLEGAEPDHDTLYRPQHHAHLGRHLLPVLYYSSQQPPRRGARWWRPRRPAPRAHGNCSPCRGRGGGRPAGALPSLGGPPAPGPRLMTRGSRSQAPSSLWRES